MGIIEIVLIPVDQLRASLPWLAGAEDAERREKDAFDPLRALYQTVLIEHARPTAFGRLHVFQFAVMTKLVLRMLIHLGEAMRFVEVDVDDAKARYDRVADVVADPNWEGYGDAWRCGTWP